MIILCTYLHVITMYLPSLTHMFQVLVLSKCYRITNASVTRLTLLPHLKELDLSYCNQIDDHGLKAIALLPKLRRLNCEYLGKISAIGIGFLASTDGSTPPLGLSPPPGARLKKRRGLQYLCLYVLQPICLNSKLFGYF